MSISRKSSTAPCHNSLPFIDWSMSTAPLPTFTDCTTARVPFSDATPESVFTPQLL